MHCNTLDYHARGLPTLLALKTSKKWWPGDLLSSTYIVYLCTMQKECYNSSWWRCDAGNAVLMLAKLILLVNGNYRIRFPRKKYMYFFPHKQYMLVGWE